MILCQVSIRFIPFHTYATLVRHLHKNAYFGPSSSVLINANYIGPLHMEITKHWALF